MLLLLRFFAATVMVGTRLLWLGVLTDGGQGRHGPAGLVPVGADILDRNGVPLARTMDAYSIDVRPTRLIGDPTELARDLNRIFPEDLAQCFRWEARRVGKGGGRAGRFRWMPEQQKKKEDQERKTKP